jgi:hypothetical protein
LLPGVVDDLDHAADQTKVRLSSEERKSGDYRKGRCAWRNSVLAIETPAGEKRKAHDGSWEVTMPCHYGYVEKTKGADGDEVDVFVVSDERAPVWVIDQVDAATREFDEHKAVLGAKTWDEARENYVKSFSDGKGPKRIGGMKRMTEREFESWATKGVRKSPVTWLPGVV